MTATNQPRACANGHPISQDQAFCGRCGQALNTEPESNEVAAPDVKVTSEDEAVNRGRLNLAAIVVLAVLAVVIIWAATRGDTGPDDRSDTQTVTPRPTEEQPFDRCFDDLSTVVAEAQLSPDPFAAGYVRWGNQDRRFELLITSYGEMQQNISQLGEQAAYDQVIQRVTDYCIDHAIEDGY